jgi:Family of unknown function (DUF5336)
MTRNAETPDTPAADGSRPAAEATPSAGVRTTQTGPVAELGLVAAGLGLVIYLIAFVADFGGSTSLVLPLLLGGGLLAGTVALPSVGNRVLAPAAVVITTGALLLLRAVVDDGGALAVGALVLGLLEAGAAVGATLMQAGVVRSRPSRNRKPPAFSGYPAGPQFPGQQYPGQPFPGTYPAGAQAAQSFPGDQWTGEHAYGQNAQYGEQYGVPGYPPPPPYGTPGYDPALHGAQAPTVAVGAEAPDHDTASPAWGTRPVSEPVADPDHGSGYRSTADPGTGTHRAVPDPSAVAFRQATDAATGTGSHRAVPDPGALSGTGSFRTGSHSAVPEGTGSHRGVSGTGSYPPSADAFAVPGPDPYRSRSADRPPDDEHTRALPTVRDEQQR